MAVLVIGCLGLLTFVGGSIFWYGQQKEMQRKQALKDQAEAEKRMLDLQIKAAQGDDVAQFSLGVGYYYGQGVKQDPTEAVKWFLKAAWQSNVQAANMLGHSYANGRGVATDLVEGYAWNGLAAKTFNAYAGARDLLAAGMSAQQIAAGQKRTEELRAQIEAQLKTTAENGSVTAQNRLGNRYYFGQGVAKNDAEAVKWYRKAAEQSTTVDAEAQNTLAWILAVSKDPAARDGKEAVKWAAKVCVATGYKDWQKVDTLAAAFAEAGDFPQAVKYQQMALDQMTLPGALLSGMQNRLKLYEEGMPFRE